LRNHVFLEEKGFETVKIYSLNLQLSIQFVLVFANEMIYRMKFSNDTHASYIHKLTRTFVGCLKEAPIGIIAST